jgi:elongation factor Ts
MAPDGGANTRGPKMAQITAALVKQLRDKTGAGMMDCKAALNETGGDIDAAVDWLRTKGLSAAEQKGGRIAAEGLIGVAAESGRGALVEINSETDFVARNETFQEMVAKVSGLALDAAGDLEKLKAAGYPDTDKSVADQVTEMIGTIGENMNLRRTAELAVENGVVASYVHNQAAPGMGKIGVLVALESNGDKDKLMAFGKQVAMHVAATNPLAVSDGELDPETVERERAVLIEQAKEEGKPPEIAEKMVEGRLRKFFKEVVLLSQIFVIDGENTVAKAAEAAAGDIGGEVKIAGFVRFALGEGIEKREDDFAAEVAAAASAT